MKTIKRILWALLIVFVSWRLGYGTTKTNSIIILDYKSDIDYTESAIELVSKHCGEIYHVFRGKVLMGYIPEDKVNLLVGNAGILNVYQNTTLPNKDDALVNSAIKAFNNLLQPVKELTEEEMQKRSLEGFKDKVRITYPTKGSKTSLSDRFTSEYMIGRVAVGIVIVEGNGDPQYNWTPQGLDSVTTQIIWGLDWLANKASESNSNVCWFYDWHYSVPVNGEPIDGPSGVDCSDEDCVVWWIAQAMSAIGYGSGGISAVYGYVHDLRYTYETDWAFVMFVANGDTFTDGQYAWAMNWNDRHLLGQPIGMDHGGPYLVMTRDNKVFGLDDMWHVVAHESFHIFGPVDEYRYAEGACENSGSCDDKFGYLQIENRNCDYCEGSTNCVMKSAWHQMACVYTRYQAGWRDSDGDGPADPIDPNSHRYFWIGPPQAEGPVQIGDIIKIFTLDGDFVKSIAITPDNCGVRFDGYCDVMWDGTNAWGGICAPTRYLLTLNDGSSHSIALLAVDPDNYTPVFTNFQFENGVLYWRLSDCWAYVRLKIYDSSNQLVLYPIKDKAHLRTDYQTDLYGLIEPETYTAEFFGWGPAGHKSDTTEYSFVYHCDLDVPQGEASLVQGPFNHYFHVTWNDDNQCHDKYEVQMETEYTYWTPVALLPDTCRSFDYTPAWGSVEYGFRVRAIRIAGEDSIYSEWSNVESILNVPNTPSRVGIEFYKICGWPNPLKLTPASDHDPCLLPDSLIVFPSLPENPSGPFHAPEPEPEPPCSPSNKVYVSWGSPGYQFEPIDYYKIRIQTLIGDSTAVFWFGPFYTLKDSLCLWPNWEYWISVVAYAGDLHSDEMANARQCSTGSQICEDYSHGGFPSGYGEPEIPVAKTDLSSNQYPLAQNYPNPFNPETDISYNLPQGCHVKLSVFNIMGQKVRTLVDEYQTAGHKTVQWDARDHIGEEVASGVYFYRLQAGEYSQVRKMLMLK